jgi:hypothetical protein
VRESRSARRRIHGIAPADDVAREMAFHLAMREAELIEGGWTPDAAAVEARRLFGDVKALHAECEAAAVRRERTSRWSRVFAEVAQDLGYGVRWLLREKGFAVVAILTLALGIGANSAVFGIVNGVLLKPLPYPGSERLAAVWEVSDAGVELPLAWPNVDDWRRSRLRTVAGLAVWQAASATTVLGAAEPVRAGVARVSGEFFSVLGVPALVGRTFSASELQPGGAPLVVVSEPFWRGYLGAERDLTRLRLELHGRVAQVVGVMPSSFRFPSEAEVWYPLGIDPAGYGDRTAHNFQGIVRLAPDANIAAARAELTSLALRTRSRHPESNAAAVAVKPLAEVSVGGSRRALLVLLGASGFVLLATAWAAAMLPARRALRIGPATALQSD